MTDMAPYYAALDSTWPAARHWGVGPVTLREGQGGGSRASAATMKGAFRPDDIAQAEHEMRNTGQAPRFMVRAGETALDAALEARGYHIHDPTTLYTLPIADLMDQPIPPVTTFCVWEPLAIMVEIWAKGGLGPARLAVMARAETKTGILARWNEKPAGAGFVGVKDKIAMVHALEILPHQRRMGVAQWIMRQAAFWGHSQGADTLSLLTTKDNAAANALYKGLGFTAIGGYHYRALTE